MDAFWWFLASILALAWALLLFKALHDAAFARSNAKVMQWRLECLAERVYELEKRLASITITEDELMEGLERNA